MKARHTAAIKAMLVPAGIADEMTRSAELRARLQIVFTEPFSPFPGPGWALSPAFLSPDDLSAEGGDVQWHRVHVRARATFLRRDHEGREQADALRLEELDSLLRPRTPDPLQIMVRFDVGEHDELRLGGS